MDNRKYAKLAVYVLLEKDGKVLLGKRKNVFGEGLYSMPSGHIERGETVIECAKKELLEETGIECNNFDFVCVRLIKAYHINDVWTDPYAAFCVKAKEWKGEPILGEPEKNENWEWHELEKLPDPLFPPVKFIIECIKKSSFFLD